jgi:hypothetical protein
VWRAVKRSELLGASDLLILLRVNAGKKLAALDRAELECACFADFACATWKLRKQVLAGLHEKPVAEAQRISEQFKTLWEHLSELGIRIEDHTGGTFQKDYAFQVLAIEPVSNLAEATVIETLRPTVYLNEQCILIGLVVVGAPRYYKSLTC